MDRYLLVGPQLASLGGAADCPVSLTSIDKTNYTELSESINSMYKWYRQSRICYAYLEDVPSATDVFGTGANRLFDPNSVFERSRWFTRGWTLQELIAPSSLIFYTADWHELGTKHSLKETIEEVTGVPAQVLMTGFVDYQSVAHVSESFTKIDMSTCFPEYDCFDRQTTH